MTETFEGRKLIVVGGSSGMGRETATAVVDAGGSAVIVGRDQQRVDDTVATLSAKGKAWGLAADLTDRDQVSSVQDRLAGEHADASLLVNAAGVFVPTPFLDHDDVWLPTKLERQLEALRNNPETPMALCAVEVVDANDAKLRTIRLRARGDLITGMLMFDGTETVSCNSTGVMRREWLLENGGYDPVFTASEDWDLLRRTVMESDVAYVDEPLVRYRVHGSNLHWDVATIERNMRYAFAKALADPRMPPSVRAKRRRAYGRLYRMLAGSYRDIGNNKAMLRCLSRAIGHDPTVSVELLARLAGKLRR